tara:strand:- start:3152 stop:4552 length:1401 start_codon:yes stop_codon:yes gene_type:complete
MGLDVSKKKLFIKTYGCQMNVYDSQRMVDILSPLGYLAIDSPEEADMVILNTCHIREKATEKVYSDLGRLKPHKEKRRSDGKNQIIAVAGCTAQAEGAEIMRRAPYVDIVFGPQSYHKLPEMVARATRAVDLDSDKKAGRGIVETDFPQEDKFDALPESKAEGVTAFLSIQEGCDKFCHFCVVPYTRGVEYSRPATSVLKEARDLVRQGVREITLLGQNVNAYHGEAPESGKEWSLGRLCRELGDIEGLDRIRYFTCHPRDVDQDQIEAHRAVEKLMPYLHLPVQAGSDAVLKAMNRKHTADFYRKIIDQFREARPDIAFTSDFIVGYPGETDHDFKETLRLVEDINYAMAYSFAYSKRPGTPGALQENQVSDDVKKERLAELQLLLRSQQMAFNESCQGRIMPVLFEKEGRHDGQLIGRTPYLQSLHAKANKRLIGQIIPVKIVSVESNSLSGEIVTGEIIGAAA